MSPSVSECANDFRTFLDGCPDLRFNEVLAAFAQSIHADGNVTAPYLCKAPSWRSCAERRSRTKSETTRRQTVGPKGRVNSNQRTKDVCGVRQVLNMLTRRAWPNTLCVTILSVQ